MGFWRTISTLAERRACAECPTGLPGEDPVFAAAVTALGAKLARADGRADGTEYEAFNEVFAPEPESRRSVRRLYDLARETTLGFESYARKLARRYARCPRLLEDVLDGLFHIAKADGAVTGREMSYLERVSDLFGLSPLTFRRLRAVHLGVGPDDPYAVLDVAPDASDETVRKAWRKALSDNHPDRVAQRGLPLEFMEVAEAKSAAINAAYDAIVRERRQIAGALQPA